MSGVDTTTIKFIRAIALIAVPCIFVGVLPILQYVKGDGGQTFANASIKEYRDGSTFRSISLFVSNAPAAGAFGFLIATTVTALSSRDNLSKFVIQKVTSGGLFLSLFLLVCTPVVSFPKAHQVTTSLVMIFSAAFLVTTVVLFRKSCAVWAVFIPAIVIFLATFGLRLSAAGGSLGYSYYFAELAWLIVVLAMTVVTVNDTPSLL